MTRTLTAADIKMYFTEEFLVDERKGEGRDQVKNPIRATVSHYQNGVGDDRGAVVTLAGMMLLAMNLKHPGRFEVQYWASNVSLMLRTILQAASGAIQADMVHIPVPLTRPKRSPVGL